MSQQTTLAVVVPYFERFVAELPDVHALAKAPEATLRRLWQGLGYYSRVRNLQRAAQMIVEQRGGHLPESHAQWRELPGCGPYTAAAIASIACGERVAAVDGNVLRVVSRLRLLGEEIHKPSVREQLARELSLVMPDDAPGDFNQAMMELGATICRPRSPSCPLCPIASSCQAKKQGLTANFPPPRPRRAATRVPLTAILSQCPSTGQMLLVSRAKGSLLARTSGFALLEQGNLDCAESLFALERAPWKGRHQITHHALELGFAHASFADPKDFARFRSWLESLDVVETSFLVTPEALAESLSSSLDRKVAAAAGVFPRERLARSPRLEN